MTRNVEYFMAGDYQRLVTAIDQFLNKNGNTLVNVIPLTTKRAVLWYSFVSSTCYCGG